MSSKEYLVCSFENWSEMFKNFIHDSIVLKIPNDVVTYLQSDVMVLPRNSSVFSRNDGNQSGFWPLGEDELEEPNFPEFDIKIKKAITKLGGRVFVKLNWSSPKDASWITSTRSLCCSDPSDIYLLLKSSTFISDDLTLLQKQESELTSTSACLVFKKWEEIHPGTEFRCFVVDNILVGISQRDEMSYFKYVNDFKEEIVEGLTSFYYSHIREKFNIKSYTFDAVFQPGKKVILLDFGVLSEKTDCLMFALEDLHKKANLMKQEDRAKDCFEDQNTESCSSFSPDHENYEKPEFRCIDDHSMVTQKPCNHYGIPIDVVHFCSEKKKVIDYIEEEMIKQKL